MTKFTQEFHAKKQFRSNPMFSFALFCLVAAKPEVKRNNVIFILTDDLDKDMDGMVSRNLKIN